MGTPHHYELGVRWTGNRGEGTASVRSFGRDHEVSADGLPTPSTSRRHAEIAIGTL